MRLFARVLLLLAALALAAPVGATPAEAPPAKKAPAETTPAKKKAKKVVDDKTKKPKHAKGPAPKVNPKDTKKGLIEPIVHRKPKPKK